MGLVYYGDNVLSSREVGYVELESLGGRQIIDRYCLTLNFKVTMRASPDSARVFVVNPGAELAVKSEAGVVGVVGALRPSGPGPIFITFPSMEHPFWATLEIPLAIAQLEAIERIRSGGAFTLTGVFWATCYGAFGPLTCQQHFERQVSLEEWIRVLNVVGMGRRVLLEVPVPSDASSTPLKVAATHLSEAHTALLHGEWRRCVSSCRDVLEAVSLETKDPDNRGPAAGPLFEKTRGLDKAGRMRIVRSAIKVLTHAAKHVDEVAVQIDWNRDDALAVLALTSAVAGHAAAQMPDDETPPSEANSSQP